MHRKTASQRPRTSYNGNSEHDEAVATNLSRIASTANSTEEIMETDKLINQGLNTWRRLYTDEKRHSVARWAPIIRNVIKSSYAAEFELMRKPEFPDYLFYKRRNLLRGIAEYDEVLPQEIAGRLFQIKVRKPDQYLKWFGKDLDSHVSAAMKRSKVPIPIDCAVDLLEMKLRDKKAYEKNFGFADDVVRLTINQLDGDVTTRIAVRALIIKLEDQETYQQYFGKIDKNIQHAVEQFLRKGE